MTIITDVVVGVIEGEDVMTDESNGNSNGHAIRDDGVDRDTRPDKPCCNRLPTGDWCTGPASHAADVHCRHLDISKPPPDVEAIRARIFTSYTKGRSK